MRLCVPPFCILQFNADEPSASQRPDPNPTPSSQGGSLAPSGGPRPATSGGPGSVSGGPGTLVPLLLSLVRLLSPQLAPRSRAEACGAGAGVRACLHSAAGVLMNLTHQHDDAVQVAVNAGVLQVRVESVGMMWGVEDCGKVRVNLR